jgi:four helix bundle protein
MMISTVYWSLPMASQRFEHAEVWKKAHAWVLATYKYSGKFPREELFGLTSQLRRAAVSVPGNFAEGFKRQTKTEKVRFYNIAQGSLEECRYYFILARDLGYGDSARLLEMVDEVSRMLAGYIRSIQGGQ